MSHLLIKAYLCLHVKCVFIGNTPKKYRLSEIICDGRGIF